MMKPQPRQLNLPFLTLPNHERKREKVDFTLFDFHISYTTKLITSFLNQKSIKISKKDIHEIARSIVVDIYFEYQRKHIQKTIIERSYKRHLYRYLRPLLKETQLLN